MNYSLWKLGIKSNYKVVLIFLAILTLYISLIISMYDPTNANILAEFAKSMPELMSMMGMGGEFGSLIGFQITYLYGFLLLLIPFIVLMMVSHKLFASLTDSGSIAYLLSTPNKRSVIAKTQLAVLGTFLIIIVGYCTTLAILVSSILFPNELDIWAFLRLNGGLLFLHFAISGITIFASCIASESKTSILFGAGIPVVFFLIQMLSNMGGKLEFLKNFSIFSLFDGNGLVAMSSESYLFIGILFIIGIVFYSLTVQVFKKRDFYV